MTAGLPTPQTRRLAANPDIKPRSRVVTDGLEATASRGMLRAVGMGDDDWAKPQIGVASVLERDHPVQPVPGPARQGGKDGVHAAGGYPLEFGTISVSDGISMGHEGMHYSLVSREIIADSVETVMEAERLDGSVLLAGCDKSLPGMLMAAARLDLAVGLPLRGLDPARPGRRTVEVTIIDAFEAVGACARGLISRERRRRDRAGDLPGRGRLRRHVHRQHDGQCGRGAGHVAARFGRPPAVDRRRDGFARRSGVAVVEIAPRDHRTADPHPAGVRERDRGGDGLRRLDQRSAAPARHRQRGRRGAGARRLQSGRRKVPHLADVKPFGGHVMASSTRSAACRW